MQEFSTVKFNLSSRLSLHPHLPQISSSLSFLLPFPPRLPSGTRSFQGQKNGYRTNTDIHLAGHLWDQADYGCAKEGCAFSAYVHQAEIFAGFFRWDDLGEIRSGQRLNSALEHVNQNRQNPELPLFPQEDSEYGNTKVWANADRDKSFCFITIG